MKIIKTIQGRIIFFLAGMLATSSMLMGYFYISLAGFADDSANRAGKNTFEQRKAGLENLVG